MAIRMFTGLGLVATALGIALVACGPSTSDPGTVAPGPTGSSTVTDSTTSAAPTTTAAESTSADGPNSCDGPGDTYMSEMLNDGNCETTAPPNCLINEFATTFGCDGTINGVGDCTECCWGDDTSLSGGLHKYQDNVSGFDVTSSIDYTQGDDFITVTGTAVEYAGLVLWFGPCTDVSMWDGVEIQVTGNLGGGQLFVQLQTDEDHPDYACPDDEADDSDDWEVCGNPQYVIEGITADGLKPIQIPWSEFTGGKPNPNVSPKQIRGVQVQVGCDLATPDSTDVTSAVTDSTAATESTAPKPTEPCAFSFELRDLRWYKN